MSCINTLIATPGLSVLQPHGKAPLCLASKETCVLLCLTQTLLRRGALGMYDKRINFQQVSLQTKFAVGGGNPKMLYALMSLSLRRANSLQVEVDRRMPSPSEHEGRRVGRVLGQTTTMKPAPFNDDQDRARDRPLSLTLTLDALRSNLMLSKTCKRDTARSASTFTNWRQLQS